MGIVLIWNSIVAGAVALAGCVVLLGRAWPTQATFGWALTFLLTFSAALVWLFTFSRQLQSRQPHRTTRTVVIIEAPLLLLSLGPGLAVYLSDQVNHQLTHFLQPTPAVVLLLAVISTAVAQEAVLGRAIDLGESVARAVASCRRWVLPLSLLLLGMLQGASYLWVIGNDFTRYWAIADATASLSGYPASINQPSYQEGGMYLYSIELPVFPLLLLVSFTLLGHDTLGAHTPALLANTVLPLLLYGLYRRAAFPRPLAFAAACAVAVFPFFRLYTLNAPVPDAVFVAFLVATGCVFLDLVGPGEAQGTRHKEAGGTRGNSGELGGTQGVSGGLREAQGGLSDSVLRTQDPGPGTQDLGPRTQSSVLSPQHAARSTPHAALPTWAAFGLLAGITSLIRPEGLLFVGLMFIGLLPNLLRPGLYLAGTLFALLLAPFSLLMISTFGIPWPRNAGSSFGLQNVADNLDWLWWLSLRWYAEPFGLPTPVFAAAVGLLTAATLAGTLWLARKRWQTAILPLAAALHVASVFTVNPRVAGADLWYDFFRHISYGMPFLALPLFWGLGVGSWGLGIRGRGAGSLGARHLVVALLLLVFAAYQLLLLSRPSQTYGGGTQLLTSDVWVSFPDLIAHRYPLPRLPFVHQEGALMIDPSFEYIPRHLQSVKAFFDPHSAINTGRGTQYEVSSLLVMLMGAGFAVVGSRRQEQFRRRLSSARFPLVAGHAGLPEEPGQ